MWNDLTISYVLCIYYIYAYITLYDYILNIYIYSIQVSAFDYLCFNFAYVQFIQVWRLGHQRFEAVTARASSLCPRLHSSRGHPTLSWRAATNHLPVIRSIFMCFDCQSLTYEEQSQQAFAGMGRASIGKRAQGWQFSAQFNLASVCHIQGDDTNHINERAVLSNKSCEVTRANQKCSLFYPASTHPLKSGNAMHFGNRIVWLMVKVNFDCSKNVSMFYSDVMFCTLAHHKTIPQS